MEKRANTNTQEWVINYLKRKGEVCDEYGLASRKLHTLLREEGYPHTLDALRKELAVLKRTGQVESDEGYRRTYALRVPGSKESVNLRAARELLDLAMELAAFGRLMPRKHQKILDGIASKMRRLSVDLTPEVAST